MKALIVEDDPVSRAVARSIFKKYCDPVCVCDGSEALAAFEGALNEGKQFDFVLIDVMMPMLSGIDAVSLMRAMEQERGIGLDQSVKIVMCTALSDSHTIYEAHASGCDDYLNKPLIANDVKRVLAKVGLLPAPKQDEQQSKD